jgi:glycine cleavage system H protein
MAEPSYPAELLYHSEHDWARVDGEEATFGITWYAQDALGEVVFFEAPAPGVTVTKDEPYAEIESVKAVSDVVAPVRSWRSTRRCPTAPRSSTRTHTGRAGSCA